jgi:NADH-quinone oxidoreductase subunit N
MINLAFVPELYFFGVLLLFLLGSLAAHWRARACYWTALALAGVGIAVCLAAVPGSASLFAGTYQVDLFSQVFKVLLAMGLFLVVCLCDTLPGVAARRHVEFYLLLFTCTLAMMFLVSSVHLLTLYVSLELSSYSLYVLVALRRERALGIEAGLKYFFTGICASAVMLLGIALLYGALQAAHLGELARLLPGALDQPAVLIGLLFTLGGLFFKLALFPFHFWAPDAYQGAPDQVAAFIATVSKVAAVAVILRTVAATGGSSVALGHALAALAVLSMTVGNLAAIAQKDYKRLMAYSSIAHAGYVLIGILSMSDAGYAAALFYTLAVLLMKFTCFLVLVRTSAPAGNLAIAQLAGLHRRSPMLAMALMLSLFGLAGIPPTIGFTGKLLVFTAAIEQGYLWLVLVAMANVVISLYYYLLVIKAAYLAEPDPAYPAPRVALSDRLLAALLVLAIVGVGFYPKDVLALAHAAVQFLS